jgi:hypothetical protein
MKPIIILGCSLGVLACDPAAPPHESMPSERSASPLSVPVPQLPTLPGDENFHIVGREWAVPICVWDKRPANTFCARPTRLNEFLVLPEHRPCDIDTDTGRPREPLYELFHPFPYPPRPFTWNLDWGAGVALYSVQYASCNTEDAPYWPGYAVVRSSYGRTDDTVAAHATGFITHIDRARVRGSVSFFTPLGGGNPEHVPVKAVLQLQNGDGTWHDVRQVVRARDGAMEVEGVFDPGSSVRLEVRIQNHPTSTRDVGLHYVRLFGAECFPLENKPGVCVE